ncbi:hypothetical protein AAG906_022964 [Vitis piasezkii]
MMMDLLTGSSQTCGQRIQSETRTRLQRNIHPSSNRQLDVNNAFLHGHLTKKVYMKQPPGFRSPEKPDHVCCLTKAIYGLKQAPRAWYSALKRAPLEFGFINAKSDSSLFVFHDGSILVYCLVYVDDLILTGNNSTFVANGLFLTQHKYIRDILAKTSMDGAKDVTTPLFTSVSLQLADGLPSINSTEYCRVIGALQYLKSTSLMSSSLVTHPFHGALKAKCNCTVINEVEYRALAMAAAESMWLLSLFQEMKFTLPQPPLLLCDNLGTTQLTRDLLTKPLSGQRTTIYETRSDYPMVTRFLGVSRKPIISNKCQLKSTILTCARLTAAARTFYKSISASVLVLERANCFGQPNPPLQRKEDSTKKASFNLFFPALKAEISLLVRHSCIKAPKSDMWKPVSRSKIDFGTI